MTLGQMLGEQAAWDPHKTAVCCGDQAITYAELDRRTTALAQWFVSQGYQHGDRVAIHWPNMIEAVELFFATAKAGLIAVPVNLRLKAAEIEYILRHSGTRVCFSHLSVAELAEQAGVCPVLRELPKAVASYVAIPQVSPGDPLVILYTSGTMARPKGAIHTHSSMIGCADLAIRATNLEEDDVGLCATQMMHAAALNCVLMAALRAGGTAALLPAFDPGAALDAIERFRVTYTGILPALLQFVAEEQTRRPRDVSSMRVMISGGDAVPLSLQNRVRELFGIPLQEVYGMSESVPQSINPADAIRLGSLGLPLTEMRIVDPDGADAGAGETGEIVVRSPANCIGYWNDPTATAELLRKGWLHTGDLGSRDADGYFWFRGRLKQIIIRAGSNISPQEVEEALYEHPAVLEAGVVGQPDAVYGETVVAFVALRDGAAVTEAELREFARTRLADYKTPERILFLPVLPKGLTGKVQRRELGAMLASA